MKNLWELMNFLILVQWSTILNLIIWMRGEVTTSSKKSRRNHSVVVAMEALASLMMALVTSIMRNL